MTDLLKKNEVTKETFNPKLHVVEYKRTCNECDKVWHSLVSREKELGGSMKYQACQGCLACGDRRITTQTDRNYDAQNNLLVQLHKCPNCSSTNYLEETIYYEKK